MLRSPARAPRRLARPVLAIAIAIAASVVLALGAALVAGAARAQTGGPAQGQKWVATWAASVQGPYPSGNASAQPELKFAFPDPAAGAHDQTFRLLVKPDLWGGRMRLRFANTYGGAPLTLDGAYVGLAAGGGNLAPGSNRKVSFAGGQAAITIPPGQSAYSDPVGLNFVRSAVSPELLGRRLAVSFHVAGSSGPMTWHAKALTTSYLTAPGAGAHGQEESDAAFPYTTASWYFLDAIEVTAPADTRVVAAFGDSITDGTASTLNGDDRWPDVLSRRLHAAYGAHVAVVNEGIGGNQILGPQDYSATTPFPGGPPALARLDRDVLDLAGLATVVWLEGINDFGAAGATPEAVIAGMEEIARRLHAHGGVHLVAATLTSALNSTNGGYGAPEVDAKRRALNQYIRSAKIFDGIVDFDAATLDPASGALKAEFQPSSTTGGPGDLLHPNRAGYQAMGTAIDLKLLVPGLALAEKP